MATITLTLIDDGKGSSPEMAITGDVTLNIGFTYEEMAEPITEAQLFGFLAVMARLGRKGRTAAQTKTLFRNGVTVTV